MNRNDFLNLIGNTVPVNRQMISEVYDLINIFPYFQSAHLLLLKGLYNSQDVKFENQLKNSAIHVASREKLYWLLNSVSLTAPATTDTINVTENATVSDQELVTDTQQTVIESAKNSELMISEIEKDSDEEKISSQKDEGQFPGHSVLIAAEPDASEPSVVIFLQEEDNSPSEDKIFFMDPGFAVPEQSDLLELDMNEDQSYSSEDEETSVENNEWRKGWQHQSELIDKFIIANPRIEPNKDKTYIQNNDLSKPFVEEEGGLVTETLAKIYVSQGYYSKALDIYEKLSLKFPEKSSYFASQIEKVKGYIKK
jgi:hypothetical protein